MVKLVLTLALVASAAALPQFGGSLDSFISSGDSFSSGGSFVSGGDSFSSGGNFISGGDSFSSGSGFVSGGSGGESRLAGITFNDGCNAGQVRHADGQCVTPEVSTNMFLYAVPAQVGRTIPAGNLPKPKVHINHVFVRTDNAQNQVRPVLGPVPKQKTIVYVLQKRPDAAQQEVIQVRSEPVDPEVVVVNFDDENDNRQLAGGVTLQEALRQSLQNARVIEAGGNSDGGSVGSSIVGTSGGIISGDIGSIGSGDVISGGNIIDSANNIF